MLSGNCKTDSGFMNIWKLSITLLHLWSWAITQNKWNMEPLQKEKNKGQSSISFHLDDHCAWLRHQMETFSTLLAICVGNSLVTSEFPAQRPVTWSFDVFFNLHLKKWLSKQWRGWWFEMPSRPFCCHSRMDSNILCYWSSCWGTSTHCVLNI